MPVATCCQTPLSGLAVALFHQVRVTVPPAFEPPDELLPPLLPQAASDSNARAAVIAAAARFRLLRMWVISQTGEGPVGPALRARLAASVALHIALCQSLSITFYKLLLRRAAKLSRDHPRRRGAGRGIGRDRF